MILFRFIGHVKYTDELQYKKAQIGDVYHAMYEGKQSDIHPKFVNSLYCYIGDWVSIEGEARDAIYYAVETFTRINGFHSSHSSFETDTIVVLAEVNKTKGTVECCNIWPKIMDEEKIRWELSDELHHCIDAGRVFTSTSGFDASLEYTRQINEVLNKRNGKDF